MSASHAVFLLCSVSKNFARGVSAPPFSCGCWDLSIWGDLSRRTRSPLRSFFAFVPDTICTGRGRGAAAEESSANGVDVEPAATIGGSNCSCSSSGADVGMGKCAASSPGE